MADVAEPNPTPPEQAPPPTHANIPAAAAPPNVNIPNVFIRNRTPGGGLGALGQNNLINVRERLFHEIYFKVALMYAQIFPPAIRRAWEYFILFKALAFFAALVYLHTAFIKNPATCLENVKDWPRDGVLRVEVIPNLEQQRALIERTKSYERLVMDLQKYYYYGIGPQSKDNYYLRRRYENILREAGYELQTTIINNNITVMYYVTANTNPNVVSDGTKIPATALQLPPINSQQTAADNGDDGDFIYSILFKRSVFLMLLDSYGNSDEQYVVEYALEYGHLRLSAATRKRLHIPVRVVQLDPMKDKCFGDRFSKFMLRKVLGYDDILMASVRVIAEQEDNKGYLRNVVTGEHYRFVSMWWAAWSSYPTAFSVMLLFTFSISMLLRFSHHQIFVFIVDLLQMLEFNITARFPIAPLLTVILALVGMEAIMSEFFNDATTAFYIILIVWIADQYDAICCHTTITKRHWLRFFYLYHFAFYAYHYRFSGQNRNLSLITSWLFIQHSMVFFFHRYELPVIVQQAQIIFLTRNQPNAAAGANAGAGARVDAGAGVGVGVGVNAARAGPNADNAATGLGGIGLNGAPIDGVGVGVDVAGQQRIRQRILFYRQQQQQMRIPLFGFFPLRNRPLNWESIQRAFLQHGWRANLPVRVQIGNVHGINVRSTQQRLGATATIPTQMQGTQQAAENPNIHQNNITATPTPTTQTTTTTTTAGAEATTTTGAEATTQSGYGCSNNSPSNAADGGTSPTKTNEVNNKSIKRTTTSPAPAPTISQPSPSSSSSAVAEAQAGVAALIPSAAEAARSDVAAEICSSGVSDVKASQSGQYQNTAAGNNHVEQPETMQNNKIENEVAHVQPRRKQQNNNNDDYGDDDDNDDDNDDVGEDEGCTGGNGDGNKIMKTECYDAVLTTTKTTTKTTTTTLKPTQDVPIRRATSTSSNKEENSNNNNNNNNNNKNNNKRNEQLENDLYAIVEGGGDGGATQSNHAPQKRLEVASTSAKKPTPTAAAAAAATITTQKDLDHEQQKKCSSSEQRGVQVKEIVRNGLTENSADMLQAINQTNIENSGLNTTPITTSSSTTITAAAAATNENVDMIDSVERHKRGDNVDKTWCFEINNTARTTTTTAAAATTTKRATSPVDSTSSTSKTLTFNVLADPFDDADRIDLSSIQNSIDGNPSNATASNNVDDKQPGQRYQQLSMDFLAHEVNHSSEF